MNIGDKARYGNALAGVIVKIDNQKQIATVAGPNDGMDTVEVDIPVLEIITIVMEVIGLVNRIFEVRIPLKIKVGDQTYNLNIRYDNDSDQVYIGYKSEKETLVGVTYGKSIRDAKKAIKQKLENAGYL